MKPQLSFKLGARKERGLDRCSRKSYKSQVNMAEKKEDPPNGPWQTPPLAWLQCAWRARNIGRSSLIADEKEPDPFGNIPLGCGYSKSGGRAVLKTP